MPCPCKAGECSNCKCAKAGVECGPQCHGGGGLDANCRCLNFAEAKQAKALPLKTVRKTLAQNGLDVMGNKNELVRRLADHLRSVKASSADAAGGGNAGGGASGGSGGAGRLIQAIIEQAEAGAEDAAILSLSGVSISSASSTADMRKAYLKLSIKIHPDKNGNSPDSKAAFQTLVTAYEALSNPEAAAAESKKPRQKHKEVVRSNEGCHKTRVNCPRCHMEWGRAELGLETAAYNLLMMGLKEYVCGRCACSFGCMTAEHKCPHCRKPFEYSPQDYHRKIVCGNSGCGKKFGFKQFKLAARREEEVRKEVKALQEARLKKREGQARRAARSSARSGPAESGTRSQEEQLFVLGLLDDCPRCGGRPQADTAEAAAAHLSQCNDSKAIAAHTAAREAAEKRRQGAARGQLAQEEAMAMAQWEFGGRQVGQLWMLSEEAIRQQCEVYNVQPTPAPDLSKPKLIAVLATALRAADRGRLLTDGSAAMEADAAPADTAGIEDVEHHELPDNLESMETEQLAAVCASYGIQYEDGDRKADLVRRIEGARYKHEPQMLLEGQATQRLTDRPSDAPKGKKRARASGDDDDDQEEEYQPDAAPKPVKKPAKKPAKKPVQKPAPKPAAPKPAAPKPAAAGPAVGAAAAAGQASQAKVARGLVKARNTASGGTEYKVRWVDCGREEDTWLSAEAVTALSAKLIPRYERKMAAKMAAQSDGTAPPPPKRSKNEPAA